MSNGGYATVFRQVSRLFDQGTVTGIDEGLLLERFVSRRDELAFEALVARFGPMVLGVCRRRLRDAHDVEDAFQATFLVLVKKAPTIRDGDLLGNWLYGVAFRVAARARANARLRRAREVAGAEEAALAQPQGHESDGAELEAVLDEELTRLPEKYRAPLVLCSLQGYAYEEAARRLNCPIGTVRSRIAKARELLRTRLVRRGFVVPAGVLTAVVAPAATQAAIPLALREATVSAAARVLAGKALTAGVVSASVGELTRGVLGAMSLTKLRMVAAALVAMVAVTTGAGILARRAAAPPLQPDQGEDRATSATLADEPVRSTMTYNGDVISKEDSQFQAIASLRSDIDIVSDEMKSLKSVMSEASESLIDEQYILERLNGRKDEQANISRGETLKNIETLQGKIAYLRKEYAAKTKELNEIREKLRQLIDRLNGRPGSRGPDDRQRNMVMPGKDERVIANQPAIPNSQGISPALEQRLSGMEQRLDQLMKALDDMRREQGRE